MPAPAAAPGHRSPQGNKSQGSDPNNPARPTWATRALWTALIVYSLTLATIALWPTHVDAPANDILRAITRAVPWLTYSHIEFMANILLFVPFGALAMLLLPRVHLWYALVAALLFSTTAELLQMLATDRTSSLQDVVANTLGAAIGILVVPIAVRRQGRGVP